MSKKYKIEGMDCPSCSTIISMSLEDEGFKNTTIDLEKNELSIPEEYDTQIEKIKDIIDNAGHYKLIIK